MASEASGLAPTRGKQVALSNWILNNSLRNPLRLVGWIFLVFLAATAVNNIISGEYELDQFLRQLIFGLSQGSIYALIALGYTLVYGILTMINFAHSEVFMAGAYMGFFAINHASETGLLQEHPLLAIMITFAAAMSASVIVAVLLERIAYRPLRRAPRLVPLITAIGASFTLQYLFAQLFGSDPRTYPDAHWYVLPNAFPNLECSEVNGSQVCLGLDLISGLYPVEILGLELRLRPISFIVFAAALLLMGMLWYIVRRTKTGKAMRAVAEDKNTAALMGINVDRVIVTTFVLGAALAGAGAILFELIPGNRQVTPFMGFFPGLKAFTAAVLGGIGNIPGAMFGGLFLGVMESVAPSLLGISSQLEDVVVFGMLVLVLIFRPTGILGEVLSEKKA
jgi:branched-chain amino acid transport system permease protein